MADDLRDEVTHLRGRLAALEAELAALRMSEAELRAMFQAMTDVVLVMNREGRYIRIGETAPDLLYRPSDDLVGKRMHDVMPREAADFFLQHIERALTDRRVVSMDYSMPIEARTVWFAANISPMTSETVILVCRDVTERKNYELLLQESLRQQELLRAQEATLMAVSTPLIPVSDDIVAMPLVGHLDQARARQVMEALLQGVTREEAKVAILDITGVSNVTAEVVEALIRAARAVQLLGARVILTGIRSDVAAAIVELGLDLRGIETRRTLQDAVRRAQGDVAGRTA